MHPSSTRRRCPGNRDLRERFRPSDSTLGSQTTNALAARHTVARTSGGTTIGPRLGRAAKHRCLGTAALGAAFALMFGLRNHQPSSLTLDGTERRLPSASQLFLAKTTNAAGLPFEALAFGALQLGKRQDQAPSSALAAIAALRMMKKREVNQRLETMRRAGMCSGSMHSRRAASGPRVKVCDGYSANSSWRIVSAELRAFGDSVPSFRMPCALSIARHCSSSNQPFLPACEIST